MISDKCVASSLPSLWARLVEDHVKLFDLTAFLHNFQELKPIDPNMKQTKMVNQWIQRGVDAVSIASTHCTSIEVTYSVIRVSKLPIQSRRSSMLFDFCENGQKKPKSLVHIALGFVYDKLISTDSLTSLFELMLAGKFFNFSVVEKAAAKIIVLIHSAKCKNAYSEYDN